MYRGIKPQEGTGAPRAPLTCHCEERSDVAISQYPAASWESYRRKRNCLPEIPTSAFGLLAMTSLGALHIRRKYLQICSCQRRSLSAATDAIGAYRFHGGRYESAVPSRDCHVGLWPPRNDKSGTVSILSLPNTNRQHCTGRGMPLPYSALREAMGKTPLSTLNSRRPAGGYPRTGISSNPGRAPMPRRGSDCSRPDCAPRPPRATARCPAAGSARPTGRNTSRFP